MPDNDEMDTHGDDPFVIAGMLVLGVLEGDELIEAQRAQLSDPEFRAAVEWWEQRLSTVAEAAPAIPPSPGVWRAINARLDAEEPQNTNPTVERFDRGVANGRAGPAGWSIITALSGAGMAAAAFALYLATPATVDQAPPMAATAPGPQLVAQLSDEAGERRLASRYDEASNKLALSITGLEAEPGKAPELWVIPEGGSPVSLGSIPESGEFERETSEAEAALLQSGATIAVTFEDDTGVPHEAPSPPILLAGALDRV